MKKWDWIIIAAVLLAALALFAAGRWIAAPQSGNLYAEIYIEGALWRTIPLTGQTREIDIPTDYGSNTLEIGQDGVKMTRANCPTQACVHTAKQTVSGGTIACLPHRVLVKLSGGKKGDVDAIAK